MKNKILVTENLNHPVCLSALNQKKKRIRKKFLKDPKRFKQVDLVHLWGIDLMSERLASDMSRKTIEVLERDILNQIGPGEYHGATTANVNHLRQYLK